MFKIHAPSFKTAFGNPIKQQISILLKLGPVAITLATRTGQYLHEGSIFWVETSIGCLSSCLEAYIYIITKPTESEQLLKLWQGALTIAAALKPPSQRNFEKNLSGPVVGPLVSSCYI